MGLDNFWVLGGDAQRPQFCPPLNLCGGMCSAHGEGSFRGKVYSRIIELASGVSIYEELDNDAVHKIAEALEARDPEDLADEYIPVEQVEDLTRMFRVYADCGAALHAWY